MHMLNTKNIKWYNNNMIKIKYYLTKIKNLIKKKNKKSKGFIY